MNSILTISNNEKEVQKNLFFVLHSENVQELSRFLISNYDTDKESNQIDFCERDANGLNVFHYCCKLGNIKMLELLIRVTENDSRCDDWLTKKTKGICRTKIACFCFVFLFVCACVLQQ